MRERQTVKRGGMVSTVTKQKCREGASAESWEEEMKKDVWGCEEVALSNTLTETANLMCSIDHEIAT